VVAEGATRGSEGPDRHADGHARPRIGVLGGTFDPPHVGHVAAAAAARDELGLDRVLLVVANDPWQKSPSRSITPAEDRFALVEAAVSGLEGVEASRLELDRGGPSYSIDTVEALRAGVLGEPADVVLIVGADLVATLPTWERAAELAKLATLAVVARPGSPDVRRASGWHVLTVDGPSLDVSSSELRERLVHGEDVEGLVPDPVMRCIRARHLYAVGR
jgi:nicotinate-nucleotide adenylyltransferase